MLKNRPIYIQRNLYLGMQSLIKDAFVSVIAKSDEETQALQITGNISLFFFNKSNNKNISCTRNEGIGTRKTTGCLGLAYLTRLMVLGLGLAYLTRLVVLSLGLAYLTRLMVLSLGLAYLTRLVVLSLGLAYLTRLMVLSLGLAYLTRLMVLSLGLAYLTRLMVLSLGLAYLTRLTSSV